MVNFIAYLPYGYPDREIFFKTLKSLDELGIYGVELGIPFSDPVADGPVIQKYHSWGVEHGITLEDAINSLKEANFNTNIFIMSYLNPLIYYPDGLKNLVLDLRKAKIKGLVIPDLPLSEWKNININYNLIPFVAPNTDEKHIETINRENPPFVYYIARYGTTGERKDLPYEDHIRKVKKLINSPLFVGFGISTPEMVKEVMKISDGVIVGSAIVREMFNADKNKVPEAVKQKVEWLLSKII